jgi:hypothetical protein
VLFGAAPRSDAPHASEMVVISTIFHNSCSTYPSAVLLGDRFFFVDLQGMLARVYRARAASIILKDRKPFHLCLSVSIRVQKVF